MSLPLKQRLDSYLTPTTRQDPAFAHVPGLRVGIHKLREVRDILPLDSSSTHGHTIGEDTVITVSTESSKSEHG